jgi:hypothetical protein
VGTLKITWASNAPWAATGYGTQTRQMIKRLLADGHEVGIAANHGLSGKPMRDPETGVPVFPNAADAYGNDVLLAHHDLFRQGQPGWIITLYDVWVFGLEAMRGHNIASWTPVDHNPVPPKVAAWAQEHPTIAMSKFGQQALAAIGVTADYAPHALDLSVWKPTPTLPDGRTVRTALNIPDDAFLVVINAANKGNVPPRKSWGEMLYSLALLMQERKDVYAYIHTEMRGVFGGVDLPILLSALGMDPERVRFADQYPYAVGIIEEPTLAAFYTAGDVLLATSMGEGFGIPVIEAQACGTPVIVTNFSAQPELVGAGWTVEWQPWWDFTQGATLALPFIASIKRRLDEAYERKGDADLAAAAIAKAAEYDADKVYAENWRPILAKLEEQLKPPKVTRQQRRAKRRAA